MTERLTPSSRKVRQRVRSGEAMRRAHIVPTRNIPLQDDHHLGRVPEIAIMAIAIALGVWACWAGLVSYLIYGRDKTFRSPHRTKSSASRRVRFAQEPEVEPSHEFPKEQRARREGAASVSPARCC
jgi:hypothetical protein